MRVRERGGGREGEREREREGARAMTGVLPVSTSPGGSAVT